jgi:hypothetical protein
VLGGRMEIHACIIVNQLGSSLRWYMHANTLLYCTPWSGESAHALRVCLLMRVLLQ